MRCKQEITTDKQMLPKKALWHYAVALTVCLFYFHPASAQMSFAELDQKMSVQKKYIVAYISSRYCTYCLMQEAQIRKSRNLKRKLDSAFYFVKGSAEADSVIFFNHQKYINPKPQNPYQVNDFINIFGKNEKGSIGYPMWLFFDKNYCLLVRIYGLMSPENILKILDSILAVQNKSP